MKENTQHNIEDEEPVSQKGKLKKFLYPLLFAIVVIGCSAGYYIYSVNTNYFSTDNAKVTAKLYSVMPVTNGKLISWDVENGDLVEQDQVLGRQETLPYITSPISGTVVKNDGAVNQMANAIDTSIFVKNGPCIAGLGLGGEGWTTMTITTPTGEGVTSARTFVRLRRCVLVDAFRIV